MPPSPGHRCARERRVLLPVLAFLLAFLWVPLGFAQGTPPAAADAPAAAEAPPPGLTAEQLDQLLAPIALYPDALLAQVMMAAAYPLDVVAADRWLAKDAGLTGDQMEAALNNQPWDISVKILTHFPSVLKYMDDNLDWTQQLGNAFVNQQAEVMASVQHLRSEAYAAGNLKSGAQQTVSVANDAITIAPTNPETVYVPQYNPTTVYTQGPTTVVTSSGTTTVVTQPSTTVVTQPGYSSGALVATGLLSFGAGVLVGSLINDNYCDWGRGVVYVPPYRGPVYAGWGRPPPGWGYNGWNRPVHYGDTTVNINRANQININNGSVQPWRPNNARRPTLYNTTAGTRPSTGNRGYGSAGTTVGGTARPAGAQGANNAFSGYGRGSTSQKDAARGAQSLNSAARSGNYKPPPEVSKPKPLPKPSAGNFNQANLNRGPSSSSAWPAPDGGRGGDRAASNRGRGSLQSAQKQGFKPQFKKR